MVGWLYSSAQTDLSDHLTVSFDIFRNYLVNFQKAAQKSQSYTLLILLVKYCNTHKILFNTINSIINLHISYEVESSPTVCERFLRFFIEKIDGIRSSLNPIHSNTLLNGSGTTASLNSFQPVSFSELRDLVMQIYNFNARCYSL